MLHAFNIAPLSIKQIMKRDNAFSKDLFALQGSILMKLVTVAFLMNSNVLQGT